MEGLAFPNRASREPLGAEDVWAWTGQTERPKGGEGLSRYVYEPGGEFRRRREGRRGNGVKNL